MLFSDLVGILSLSAGRIVFTSMLYRLYDISGIPISILPFAQRSFSVIPPGKIQIKM